MSMKKFSEIMGFASTTADEEGMPSISFKKPSSKPATSFKKPDVTALETFEKPKPKTVTATPNDGDRLEQVFKEACELADKNPKLARTFVDYCRKCVKAYESRPEKSKPSTASSTTHYGVGAFYELKGGRLAPTDPKNKIEYDSLLRTGNLQFYFVSKDGRPVELIEEVPNNAYGVGAFVELVDGGRLCPVSLTNCDYADLVADGNIQFYFVSKDGRPIAEIV